MFERISGNKPPKYMAFPHPQSGKDHHRNKDKAGCGGVVWNFVERAINIAEHGDGKENVNPAKYGKYDALVQSFVILLFDSEFIAAWKQLAPGYP